MENPSRPTDALPVTTDLTDGSLLRRFEQGEGDAATAIYLRYAQRLQFLARAQLGKGLAVRLDPEDVVQSVFRTFFRRAAQGHYEVPAGDELWRLLLVISLNKVRGLGEHHRAAKRDVGHTTEIEKVAPFLADSGDEQAYRTLRLTIDELLADLPVAQREMIAMRIEGHDINRISDTSKRAKRTVERVLQTFRTRLHAAINEE